ncbi:MAG: helix-turn-helix transcriptional regulator [Deltaproteobacteria bacterium]|nr:helix-turn-helix transcriptional regulator [Deltaproteobacteria bacterium]
MMKNEKHSLPIPLSKPSPETAYTVIQIYQPPFHVTLKVSCRAIGRKERHNATLALLSALESRLGVVVAGSVFDSDEPYSNRTDRGFGSLRTQQILDTDAQILGYRIRMRRLALGLSQRKLAKLMDLNSSHLSCIEHGHHAPHPSTLEKLERLLGPNLKSKSPKGWEARPNNPPGGPRSDPEANPSPEAAPAARTRSRSG